MWGFGVLGFTEDVDVFGLLSDCPQNRVVVLDGGQKGKSCEEPLRRRAVLGQLRFRLHQERELEQLVALQLELEGRMDDDAVDRERDVAGYRGLKRALHLLLVLLHQLLLVPLVGEGEPHVADADALHPGGQLALLPHLVLGADGVEDGFRVERERRVGGVRELGHEFQHLCVSH